MGGHGDGCALGVSEHVVSGHECGRAWGWKDMGCQGIGYGVAGHEFGIA